jgi:hypothetical protein
MSVAFEIPMPGIVWLVLGMVVVIVIFFLYGKRASFRHGGTFKDIARKHKEDRHTDKSEEAGSRSQEEGRN